MALILIVGDGDRLLRIVDPCAGGFYHKRVGIHPYHGIEDPPQGNIFFGMCFYIQSSESASQIVADLQSSNAPSKFRERFTDRS